MYPERAGEWEYEQSVIWNKHNGRRSDSSAFDLTHEIETGLAENVELGLYLAQRQIQNQDGSTSTEFQGAGYNNVFCLLTPSEHALGIGSYNENLIDPDKTELEPKLLLQHNWDAWVFIYNAIAETKIEREQSDTNVMGNIAHTLGISHSLGKLWLGAESQFRDWSDYHGPIVWCGPSINHWRRTQMNPPSCWRFIVGYEC